MNKALLEYEMKRKGVTATQMAKILGISRSTFWKKCTGSSEFKQSEIMKIVSTLQLTDAAAIFFAE